MKRKSLVALGALALLGALACDADDAADPAEQGDASRAPHASHEPEGPIEIPALHPGGQSGAEGGCARPPVDALSFTVEDALALVAGEHESELSWQPWWSSAAGEPRPLQLNVVVEGEPEIDLSCGGELGLDVEVELALPDVPRVRFAGRVSVLSREEAHMQVTLDARLAEYLALPEPAPSNHDGEPFRLELWFYPSELRGKLGTSSEDALLCPLAVWPPGATFFRGEAVDAARAAELGAGEALARVQQLALNLSWDGGGGDQTFQLQVSARDEPVRAWPDTLSAGSNTPATTFAVPVALRLGAEGGPELSLRGELLAQSPAPGTLSPKVLLSAEQLAPASAFGSLTDLDADALVWLSVRVGVKAGTADGGLSLARVDAHASVPPLTAAIEQPFAPECFGPLEGLREGLWAPAE